MSVPRWSVSIRLAVLTAAVGLCTASAGSWMSRTRTVSRNQAGGVLALEGDRGAARQKALQEIAQHCGTAGYDVIQEGEVVIGLSTYGTGSTTHTEHTSQASAGVVTSEVTEYRMSYSCGRRSYGRY